MLTERTRDDPVGERSALHAAKQPSGMPSSAAQPMPAAISARVKGICSDTVTRTGAVGEDVGAEIAGHDAAEKARDLHHDGLVEAHLDAEGLRAVPAWRAARAAPPPGRRG